MNLKSYGNILDDLLPKSVPSPALSLHFSGVLEQNFELLDQRFLRSKPEAHCVLNKLKHP